MNKNKLKTFAKNARTKLLVQVKNKLDYLLTLDSSEIKNKENQINQLKNEINNISQDQVIEKVAYTWFNRLIALRFMDANNYHTLNIKSYLHKKVILYQKYFKKQKEEILMKN